MSNFSKFFVVILFVLSNAQLFAQAQFSGKITGDDGVQIFLSYSDSLHKQITDSCRLKNQSFSFKVNIAEPTRVLISAKPTLKGNNAMIFLEPGKITATGDYQYLSNLKIAGSKTQNENQDLQAQLDVINKDFAPVLSNLRRLTNEVSLAKKSNQPELIIDSLDIVLTGYEKQRQPFVNKYEDVVRRFVISHPNSLISAIQTSVYAVSWPLDSVKLIYGGFNSVMQNSSAGLEIKKTINEREVKAAMPAVNFSKPDLTGKTLNLADFKGNYVLLDFWGSWCLPCRETTPHLKELFSKYHQSGLAVIAIACNDDADDWKKAIKKDSTALWYNIMDEPSHSAKDVKHITNDYNVHVFPTKILIDKNGMIIGRYDSDSPVELDKKLAEIFK